MGASFLPRGQRKTTGGDEGRILRLRREGPLCGIGRLVRGAEGRSELAQPKTVLGEDRL
jgi:hypothetical protein